MSVDKQIEIQVQLITPGDDGRPSLGDPSHITLGWKEKLVVLFDRWREEQMPDTAADQLEFLMFPFGNPNEAGSVHLPAPLKEDHTPESLKLPQGIRFYVRKRSDHLDYALFARIAEVAQGSLG